MQTPDSEKLSTEISKNDPNTQEKNTNKHLRISKEWVDDVINVLICISISGTFLRPQNIFYQVNFDITTFRIYVNLVMQGV